MKDMRSGKNYKSSMSKPSMPKELAYWELRESLEKGIILVRNTIFLPRVLPTSIRKL